MKTAGVFPRGAPSHASRDAAPAPGATHPPGPTALLGRLLQRLDEADESQPLEGGDLDTVPGQPFSEDALPQLAEHVRGVREHMLARQAHARQRNELETVARIQKRLQWLHKLVVQQRWRELSVVMQLGLEAPQTEGGDGSMLYPVPSRRRARGGTE